MWYLRFGRMGISQRGLKAYVFREADDKPRVQYYRIAGKFKEAVQRAGLGRNVTLQDCRRTVGSLLAEQGIYERVAMEFLGHANIATTDRHGKRRKSALTHRLHDGNARKSRCASAQRKGHGT